MYDIVPDPLTGDELFYHYQNVLNVKKEMESAVSSDEDIQLDLSTAKWFNPTFLAPMCVLYNTFDDLDVNIHINPPTDTMVQEYLNQICFPHGTLDPVENYTNHIPLCLMKTSLSDDIVEVIGEKIRELLKQRLGEDLSTSGLDWVHYPIAEIIDNVDTHSNCDYGAVIVQDYPNKDFLDICIADNGISIPGSYEEFGISISDNRCAILKAITEGISTRPDTGYERGFGLRTTTEMVCDGLCGSVLLSSRDSTIIRHQNQELLTQQTPHWSGTVFAARLHHPSSEFAYLDYLFPD